MFPGVSEGDNIINLIVRGLSKTIFQQTRIDPQCDSIMTNNDVEEKSSLHKIEFCFKEQKQVLTNHMSAAILFHYSFPPPRHNHTDHHHHCRRRCHRHHYHYCHRHHYHCDDAEEAPSMRLAVETLEELDWCLDQLESLQVPLRIIMISTRMITRTRTRSRTRIWRTSMNQIVSDPPECVGHGSEQVQENVEQRIVRVQVNIVIRIKY